MTNLHVIVARKIMSQLDLKESVILCPQFLLITILHGLRDFQIDLKFELSFQTNDFSSTIKRTHARISKHLIYFGKKKAKAIEHA